MRLMVAVIIFLAVLVLAGGIASAVLLAGVTAIIQVVWPHNPDQGLRLAPLATVGLIGCWLGAGVVATWTAIRYLGKPDSR